METSVTNQIHQQEQVEGESSCEHSNRDLSTLVDECDDCHDIQEILRVASDLSGDGERFKLRFPKTWDVSGHYLASVSQRFLESRNTRCQLCLILGKSRISNASPEGNYVNEDTDELRALPFAQVCKLVRNINAIKDPSFALLIGPRRAFRDIRDLYPVVENGIAVLSKPQGTSNLVTPRTVPEYYDPAMVRAWIQYCQKYHKFCLPRSSIVEGMKLINCDTRVIGPAADSDKYVALSYVWGKSNVHSNCNTQRVTGSQELPASLPRVIGDAISVTKSLGYRFLWVDKLCIDQKDPNTRHTQIQQMHIIYEKAELALIAACGADRNNALAGVSTPRIGMQINLGKAAISWVIDPQHLVRHSHWSKRGWTFQEAVLARRRLLFTKQQVYFECNAMNCCENLHTPLDSLHVKDKSRIRVLFRAGLFDCQTQFGKMNPIDLSVDELWARYCVCVEDYSKRELTYDADALNAFQGIIQRVRSRESKSLAEVFTERFLPFS
ncbi:heterokaryon incompatibility protein-domain-containing protein [Nemania abortiva]|nr:heterokaryon incompatibility protein-domain-containing protein [Nemania abortiva]